MPCEVDERQGFPTAIPGIREAAIPRRTEFFPLSRVFLEEDRHPEIVFHYLPKHPPGRMFRLFLICSPYGNEPAQAASGVRAILTWTTRKEAHG
jgi:hypothetical protein